MDKDLLERLKGVDVFGLPITNFIHPDTRDNNIVGYNYLTVSLLKDILEELKKLNNSNGEKKTTKKEEVKETSKK
jgi:hypothetical protein